MVLQFQMRDFLQGLESYKFSFEAWHWRSKVSNYRTWCAAKKGDYIYVKKNIESSDIGVGTAGWQSS